MKSKKKYYNFNIDQTVIFTMSQFELFLYVIKRVIDRVPIGSYLQDLSPMK